MPTTGPLRDHESVEPETPGAAKKLERARTMSARLIIKSGVRKRRRVCIDCLCEPPFEWNLMRIHCACAVVRREIGKCEACRLLLVRSIHNREDITSPSISGQRSELPH